MISLNGHSIIHTIYAHIVRMCLICIDIYSLTIRTILFKFPNAHLLKPRPYALNFCCSLLKVSSLKLTMEINLLFPMYTKWGDVRYFEEIRVNKINFYQIRSHGWWSRSLMVYLPKMIN